MVGVDFNGAQRRTVRYLCVKPVAWAGPEGSTEECLVLAGKGWPVKARASLSLTAGLLLCGAALQPAALRPRALPVCEQ